MFLLSLTRQECLFAVPNNPVLEFLFGNGRSWSHLKELPPAFVSPVGVNRDACPRLPSEALEQPFPTRVLLPSQEGGAPCPMN